MANKQSTDQTTIATSSHIQARREDGPRSIGLFVSRHGTKSDGYVSLPQVGGTYGDGYCRLRCHICTGKRLDRGKGCLKQSKWLQKPNAGRHTRIVNSRSGRGRSFTSRPSATGWDPSPSRQLRQGSGAGGARGMTRFRTLAVFSAGTQEKTGSGILWANSFSTLHGYMRSCLTLGTRR